MTAPLTATSAAAALASRDVRSLDLVEACIARIERYDDRIRAIALHAFDAARVRAQVADVALRAGQRLLLLGVPITLKESMQVAGMPATLGLTGLQGHVSNKDAPVVRRLLAAGAIPLGKTNLAEGLNDWQCSNPVYGRTCNPWSYERTPGGSSGGSAAAVAAAFSYLDIGSDVAGSITIPAHFCGVYGHRPSYGVVPSVGTGMPGLLAPADLASVGPLARSSVDLQMALDLLAGPMQPEAAAYRLQLPEPEPRELADFRVLVLQSHPLVPTARDVQQPLMALAAELREAGATVHDEHPDLPDLAEATRLYVRLLMSTRLRHADGAQRQRAEEEAKLARGVGTLGAIAAQAAVAPHHEWLLWNEQRVRLRAAWGRVFRDVDVILCPPSPVRAFAHIPASQGPRFLNVDGQAMPYFDQLAWVSLAIGSGLPVTTVPLERDPQWMPCGVQVIGGFLRDKTTLSFARALERRRGPLVLPQLPHAHTASPPNA